MNEELKQVVGAEFIITRDKDGWAIKRNESGADWEFFTEEEFKPLLNTRPVPSVESEEERLKMSEKLLKNGAEKIFNFNNARKDVDMLTYLSVLSELLDWRCKTLNFLDHTKPEE